MPKKIFTGGLYRRRNVRVCVQSAALMLGLPLLSHPAAALTIKPYYEASITGSAYSTQIIGGIQTAIRVFESTLTNPVTVNIQFGYGTIDGYAISGGLATAAPSWTGAFYSASQMGAFLQKTATSSSDAMAYGHLPTTVPTGASGYWMTTAQAKAIGLMSATSSVMDGKVGFSTQYAWTFDSTNGVAGGTYDFLGVAMSEISSVLGRMSGLGPAGSNAAPSALDMFRCSSGTNSFSFGTASTFAIDGCKTALQNFNSRTTGDTGDWDNSNPADTANAFKYAGQKYVFTSADLIAMDVIGWNTTTTVAGTWTTTTTTTSGGGGKGRKGRSINDLAGDLDVPEPFTLSLLGTAIAALGLARSRRNRRAAP